MMEKIIEMLEELGADVSYYVRDLEEDGLELAITIEDFEGFDENWSEIMRELDDEEAVDAFLEWLEEYCISKGGDFYREYQFEGFAVELGYASFDI